MKTIYKYSIAVLILVVSFQLFVACGKKQPKPVQDQSVSQNSNQPNPTPQKIESKPQVHVGDVSDHAGGVGGSGKLALNDMNSVQAEQLLSSAPMSKKSVGVFASGGLGGYSGNVNQGGAGLACRIAPNFCPPTQGHFNREEYTHISEADFLRVKDNPLSTFSIDVDAASYSNVRRFLRSGQLPPKDAVRIEELVNYFPYHYPEPDGDHPCSITTNLAECPWKSDHLLLHIGIKARSICVEEAPANNLVFLLDVSGSMADYNKLPLVKRAFQLLVEELRPIDRIAIVTYAGNSRLALPSTCGSNKRHILQAINELEAGGCTAGASGIQLAYRIARENYRSNGNNRVILATDGDFNVGVSSSSDLVRMIEEKRKSGIFLTVLGFGEGNLQDGKMEQLADKGNGQYHYIDNILEARKVFVNELGGTLSTVAKDVKIQVEFNPSRVQAYRLVGYENRALRNEEFNDDKKDAGDMGAGHTVTALYELIPTGVKTNFPSIDPLRYQSKQETREDEFNGEWSLVKLRYKEPKGNESRLITQPVTGIPYSINRVREDTRFAASVAAFGMLLRSSNHKGHASFPMVLELARSSFGDDPEGYRHEFIRLAETAESLMKCVPESD